MAFVKTAPQHALFSPFPPLFCKLRSMRCVVEAILGSLVDEAQDEVFPGVFVLRLDETQSVGCKSKKGPGCQARAGML